MRSAAIRLAMVQDAPAIAAMSQAFIEHGLGWSWQAPRVLAAIRDRATNVAVAQADGPLLGFGIMQYADDSAHLALLAVQPQARHQGLGKRLVLWLEDVARTAGIERLRVEARADNANAIAFYRAQGFQEFARSVGYYSGRIDAVRLEKRLFVKGIGL
ncbi:GNAT family N-acetyltransferase [uncultured Ramlibacter sp.]|uniref:GNAT family N-acetyltransferase n=1 Tax=uncultured Ramlibacter sp. TaxID=260755 RepID=UPI00262F07BE|nr:GNAT family N-acetyltransferase [uncultured Ramlibacter sp.]